MSKLDRTSSSTSNLFEQKEEVIHYKGMEKEEIAKVFAYLNSVSYNYPIGLPPKMDKSMGSSRKN